MAGVTYNKTLYYSSYNFGGIWKLNIDDGKTEMIAMIPENRKHEFAFRINEQIWFIPAYQEKNIFDVLDINTGVVKNIAIRPSGNNKTVERKYSNFIEFDSEIWVMPSTIEYIVIIEKNSGKLRYVMLSDMKIDATDNNFVSAVNVGKIIYMYEVARNQLLRLDTETKEICWFCLKEQECTYRNIVKYGKYLYIIPKNINGNSILKYDSEKDAVVDEKVIINDTNKGELICTGSALRRNRIFLAPYNFSEVIIWTIDREIEEININCIQDKTAQQLYYWEAVNTEEGFFFGIEQYGAPLIYIKDDEKVILIESKADELKDGLLKVIL
ncbi:MAG: hypothetical protein MR817_01975 [Lachnospiraceae bacterium]|nr:hypothetical protein [Lachnospiraceae bacterium]